MVPTGMAMKQSYGKSLDAVLGFQKIGNQLNMPKSIKRTIIPARKSRQGQTLSLKMFLAVSNIGCWIYSFLFRLLHHEPYSKGSGNRQQAVREKMVQTR